MIEIRLYKECDKTDVISLVLSCQNDGSRAPLTCNEQPDLLDIFGNYFANKGAFWVATDNGHIIGSIGLINCGNGNGILKKFFLYPEYRGSTERIGQQLYSGLLNLARELKLQSIILDTPKNTARAHNFYLKAGFVKVNYSALPISYSSTYSSTDSDFFQLHLTYSSIDLSGRAKNPQEMHENLSANKYNRIAIIGCGGSGKSYLATRLAAALKLPCYHMDMLFWQPNWTPTPIEEFLPMITGLAEQERWVIDGNYSSTMDVRLSRANLVIFLDMPTDLCLASERARRGIKRTDLPDFLVETEDKEFIEYITTFYTAARPSVLARLDNYCNCDKLILTSRADVDILLSRLV